MMNKQVVKTKDDSLTNQLESNVVSIYTKKRQLNPVDDNFDFSLWSKVVKKQMLEVVERKR